MSHRSSHTTESQYLGRLVGIATLMSLVALSCMTPTFDANETGGLSRSVSSPAWSDAHQHLRLLDDQLRVSLQHLSRLGSTGYPPVENETSDAFLASHELRNQARAVLSSLERLPSHGLPSDPDAAARLRSVLRRLARGPEAPTDLVRTSIEETIAEVATSLVYRLRYGTTAPQWVGATAPQQKQKEHIRKVMSHAVANGSVAKIIQAYTRQPEGYKRLKRALATYRRIAAMGAWPHIPDGPTITVGDVDPRVPILRQRLLEEIEAWIGNNSTQSALHQPTPIGLHDMSPIFTIASSRADQPANQVFDTRLHAALRDFQRRHGLSRDGELGPRTLAALNVSASDRIEQIRLNLERYRWAPADSSKRRIVVNVPAFELYAIGGTQESLSMRVIVGRNNEWKTPLIEAELTRIVVNPYWRVPSSIFSKEMLPNLRKNPSYLTEKNIEILKDSNPIDPTQVAWSEVSRTQTTYRARQQPGPGNALGKIKFALPNRFHIYLHDTPAPSLFERANRSLSHGCARVERPMELARWLVQSEDSSKRERLARLVASEGNAVINLANPVRVEFRYFTAWVDSSGLVHFRPDVYEKDRLLARLMEVSE